MDHLHLYKDPSTPFGGVDVYINGRLLREMLREVELPAATAEGFPELASTYMGRSPERVFLPGRVLLGEPDATDEFGGTGKVTVLDCDCGNSGCSPIGVRITLEPDRVVWSNFELYRGGFGADYSNLGPFTFDRTEYMQELNQAGLDRYEPNAIQSDRGVPARPISPPVEASSEDSIAKTYLFTVDDTFEIVDRGRVVTSDIAIESGTVRLKRDDRVLLRTPDGLAVEATVLAVETSKEPDSGRDKLAVMLPDTIERHQVPKNTEVFRIG